jgi:L-ribulose-5-phosphate 3-epimerase
MYKTSIMRGTLPRNRHLKEMLGDLKKAGFDGVQIGIEMPEIGGPDAPMDRVNELRRRMLDAGLTPHGTYAGSRFFKPNKRERRQEIDNGKRCLDISAALGADVWLLHPGQVTPQFPYDEAYRVMTDALNTLKGHAEATHVKIGIENVWNKFLLSPLEAARLIDEIGSPNVGLFFDTGNIVYIAYPEQWARILGKRIVALHVKDFLRRAGDSAGFVPLFHGDIDWPALMKELKAIPFSPWIISEQRLGSKPLPLALKDIANSIDAIKQIAASA